jgi:AcrR family transcriptional regulator
MSTASRTGASPRRGGRPRHAHADEAILTATLAELAENGVAGVTIAGVARRAGVARGSVALRWASRDELLLAALETTGYGLERPRTDSLDEAIRTLVTAWIAVLSRPRMRLLLTRLIADRDAFPTIWARYEETIAAPAVLLIDEVLRDAAARGELRTGIRPDVVRSCLIGAVWLQRDDDPAFARHLADFLLAAVRAEPGPT